MVKINKPESLGVLPGSNPPVMAWHFFDVKKDSGMVSHFIDGELRANIAVENFADYVKNNVSIIGLEVTEEATISSTVSADPVI